MRSVHSDAEPETLRILALRVDFLNDTAGDESTGDGRFDMRAADSAKIAIDPPPTTAPTSARIWKRCGATTMCRATVAWFSNTMCTPWSPTRAIT